MGFFGFSSAKALQPVSDHFMSLSVGNTLVLKACGFIEDYQARILDVTETSLKVRTGTAWYEQFHSSAVRRKPMEIELLIKSVDLDAESDAQRLKRNPNHYCVIDVSIRPASRGWKHQEFQDQARKVLWALRSYFMAC